MTKVILCMFAVMLLAGIVSAADRPNIVRIFVDDMRYGNPLNKTPHIDRLASEGHQWEA